MNLHNAQEWWDSFHPIDRESICERFYLSKELAHRDFFELPGYIRLLFYGRWNTQNSIIRTDHEWEF
jgi:hypothetical protein